MQAFAGKPNGGLVLPPDSTNILHRDVLIALAAKHSLPSVYGYRSFTEAGGLMSYSTDVPQQNRLGSIAYRSHTSWDGSRRPAGRNSNQV